MKSTFREEKNSSIGMKKFLRIYLNDCDMLNNVIFTVDYLANS